MEQVFDTAAPANLTMEMLIASHEANEAFLNKMEAKDKERLLNACWEAHGIPCSPSMTPTQLLQFLVCGPKAQVEETPEEIAAQVVEAKADAPKTKKLGIGKTIIGYLSQGLSPKETLALVLTMFPQAKTTMACVYWYQSKLNTNAMDKTFHGITTSN